MTKAAPDETLDFTPKWNADGLMPAIAVDDISGDVLMLAYVNEESLKRTLTTGEVHYWSRSRQELWYKGATSGHTQKLISIQIDCDQDTLLLRVIQAGPACHTGRRTCFYRSVEVAEGSQQNVILKPSTELTDRD